MLGASLFPRPFLGDMSFLDGEPGSLLGELIEPLLALDFLTGFGASATGAPDPSSFKVKKNDPVFYLVTVAVIPPPLSFLCFIEMVIGSLLS